MKKNAIIATVVVGGIVASNLLFGGVNDVLLDTASESIKGQSLVTDAVTIDTSKELLKITADIDSADVDSVGKNIDVQIQVLRNGVWENYSGFGFLTGKKTAGSSRPGITIPTKELNGKQIRVVANSTDIKTKINITEI